ncbi:hypothetical protein BRC77_13850 [Halobacteriales archaeon QH_8_64_26]|nr:MAG: hypothetical protein BRC77_13850 [Halobacteriales archaeon QH_8_64_26]
MRQARNRPRREEGGSGAAPNPIGKKLQARPGLYPPTMAEHTTLDGAAHAAVFEADHPRTIRLRLAAGEDVPAHRHLESDVVLYLLVGALRLARDRASQRP